MFWAANKLHDGDKAYNPHSLPKIDKHKDKGCNEGEASIKDRI
jgi:hypothetical protein